MKTLTYVLPLLLTGIGLARSSQAQIYTFNFDVPQGNVTSGHVYFDTQNKYSLTAYGYLTAKAPSSLVLGSTWNTGTITTNGLYGKYTAGNPGETGLGLANKDENEIDGTSFVQLDVSDLKKHGLTNLTMSISSIQSSEGFDLWGSNIQGTPGTLLKFGSNPTNGGDIQSFLVPNYNDYNYFSTSASGGNVLIKNGLQATAPAATPEPGTLALLVGMGISGSVFFARRRRSARKAAC